MKKLILSSVLFLAGSSVYASSSSCENSIESVARVSNLLGAYQAKLSIFQYSSDGKVAYKLEKQVRLYQNDLDARIEHAKRVCK